jgi:predicted MPP superfamily phosphohydrolase
MWFVAIFLSIFVGGDLLWAYLAARALRRGGWSRWWWAAPLGWVGVQFALLYIVIISRGGFNDAVPGWVVTLVLATTFVWHLLVMPSTLLALGAMAAVKGLWRLARRKPRPTAVHEPGPRWSRRAVLGMGVAVAPPVLAGGVTWRGISELNSFRVRHIETGLAGLPKDLDGLRIAHVTDTHVGELTRGAKLREIAERTNLLKADLILLTGDLINRSLSDLPAAMEMVGRMESRYGLAMCEGNHDLFQGRHPFVQGVRAAGVPLLVDERMELTVRGRPVDLLGVRWQGRRGNRPEEMTEEQAYDLAVQRLAAGVRPEAFAVMLAHHPHVFDAAAKYGVPLTLAGHTHGGQLHATPSLGFGPLMYKYWSGLYRQNAGKGEAAVVVGNGTGNWFPVRLNVPAEIICLTLRSV